MTPNVDDRVASVIRALGEIVLPALPASASLAREQTQLVIGHLAILRAQLDRAPEFERDEAAAVRALAEQLARAEGGAATRAACDALRAAVTATTASAPREAAAELRARIDALVRASARDGSQRGHAEVLRAVHAHEVSRARADRAWFAPMGFDAELAS
jgi:hypothetical protein